MISVKGVTVWGVVIIIAMILLVVIPHVAYGIFPFGPYREVKAATINRLYVDIGTVGDITKSSYMVGTDKGVFEIDNSIFMGIYNADELYSSIRVGKTYDLTTKGNKVLGWFFQEYPFIINIAEVVVVVEPPPPGPPGRVRSE